MSEIRPTNSRPEIHRPQTERPVKMERRPQAPEIQQAADKVQNHSEVKRREMSKSTNSKGGNVDITV